MEILMTSLLSNAAVALPLMGLAWLAGRLLPRHPALAHALWLLVFVKLLTPPLWLPAIPVADISSIRPATEPSRASVVTLEPSSVPGVADDASAPSVSSSASTTIPPATLRETAVADELPPVNDRSKQADLVAAPKPDVPQESTESFPSSTLLLFGGVWLIGSALMLLFTIHRLVRFRRVLAYAEEAPPWLQGTAERMAGRLGCPQAPPVFLLEGTFAPMLYSLASKTLILLPRKLVANFDQQALEALLLHELAHWRRRDHWLRYLEIGALVLYWWHPGVWFARRGLRAAEEECCDALVSLTLHTDVHAYASALMATVDFLATTPQPMPVVGSGLSSFQRLQRRLTMMQSTNRAARLPRLGRWGLLMFACAVLPFGARLTGEPPAEEGLAQPPRENRGGDWHPPPWHPPPAPPGERGDVRGGRRPAPSAPGGMGPLPARGGFGFNRAEEFDKNQMLFDARAEIRLMRIQLRMREEELKDAMERAADASEQTERLEIMHSKGVTTQEEVNQAKAQRRNLERQVRMRELALMEFRERLSIAEERVQLIEDGKLRVGPGALGGWEGQGGPPMMGGGVPGAPGRAGVPGMPGSPAMGGGVVPGAPGRAGVPGMPGSPAMGGGVVPGAPGRAGVPGMPGRPGMGGSGFGRGGVGAGTVPRSPGGESEPPPHPPRVEEVEQLKQQIQELRREIERLRKGDSK